ncbi:Cytochrome c oxidase assembly protein COX16, mitochondrial [Erysiphe necator]|uniref:Cytochrome c oxidase assembly protein COX16, mitochondrial n=1 Tax=Uncinula necator TaxID=52586 RepID=A0A0B1PEM6_UNCNE|nr:Cytochrome c oxidase assembly protein COX16, mitochondrial [Erysiphe necator]KHJ35351.1 putative cytochrome c oxidase-assembly factor cox- precursor [Erysiphe necator]
MEITIPRPRSFQSKPFKSSTDANTIAARYRRMLARHPFLLFGFPFITTMVAGSFFLTPATAVRFEKHDRKVRRMTSEEALSIGKTGRKVDMKEEYYRLAAKDLDNWEQKRVKRLPGEPDGKL